LDIMKNNKWEFHNTILLVYLKNNFNYIYGGTSLALPETTKHVFTIKNNYICINGDGELIHFFIPKNKQIKDINTITNMDSYVINDEIIVLDHNWVTNVVIFTCKEKATNTLCYMKVNFENARMITRNINTYERSNTEIIELINSRERPENEVNISLKYDYTKQEIITILANNGIEDAVTKVMVWHEDMTKDFFTRAITWIGKNINHLDKIKVSAPKPKILNELKTKVNTDRMSNINAFVEDCAVVLCKYILQYRTCLPFKLSMKFFDGTCTLPLDIAFSQSLMKMFDLEMFKNMSLIDRVYFVNGPE
jgi:hypothetical protein